MKKWLYLLLVVTGFSLTASAQTAEELVQKAKEKLDKVSDYEASGTMKMNVIFIKAPVAKVKVYYKKPDKLRIKNESGISLIPKGSVNINLGNVLSNPSDFTIIDAGKEDKTNLRVIKMLPKDDKANVILSTLYIDEKTFLVKKAMTTTRENGTYELEMTYGKYSDYGLADKVLFKFNIKDYKLPKGVTFDYDDGTKEDNAEQVKDKKGKIEIVYSSYSLNKGIPDSIFQ
jgi:outer membrane lipoprotein-sorting protein